MIATIFSSFNCKGFFNDPSMAKSFADSAIFNASLFRPLRDCHRFAIEIKNCIIPFIVILSRYCGPPTIIGRVTFTIVYSVYRHPIWFFSHITKKIAKIHPSFTYGYSSASVIFVVLMGFTKTSFSHCDPSLIGWSVNSITRMAMFFLVFNFLAIAVRNISSANLRNNSFANIFANCTAEIPIHISVRGVGIFKKYKIPEFSTAIKSFVFWHSCHFFIISFFKKIQELIIALAGKKLADLHKKYAQRGGSLA